MEFDKEKIKFKIAISKIKEESDIVMESKNNRFLKLTGAMAAMLILGTGIVFAATFIQNKLSKKDNRGLGEGVQKAIESGYIEETNMDYIEESAAILGEQVDNVNVQVRVDDFLMDDRNISLKFSFIFDENIDEYINLENIKTIDFKDLKIIDEEGRFLNERAGRMTFPTNVDKEHHRISLMYDIVGGDFPKSKELHISFEQILITENGPIVDERKSVVLTGEWSIDLDVPEKMYNRTNEYYKVVSCDNKDFDIYATLVNDTGFEIGVIISNVRKSKDEINEDGRIMTELYNEKLAEIYERDGIDENSSMEEKNDASNEAIREITERARELLLDHDVIDDTGRYWKSYKIANGEDISNVELPDTRSYVENSNGEKFYASQSPGRRSDSNYLEDYKFSYYETFIMTKQDATDRIKVVLFYYGEPVTIELEKIK